MINERYFGTTTEGQTVSAFELTGKQGLRASILNYGATLQALYLPDGRNIVLGHEAIESYLLDTAYLGRIIGRNANRITPSTFEIGGERFPLTPTDAETNLHSGPLGFDSQVWSTSIDDDTLVLRHTSPDGDQGFPGELNVTLRISVDDMSLRLEMEAETTRPTPVNMTWHPYWNLLGQGRVDGHTLSVDSSHTTQLECAQPISVNGTRFDFRNEIPLGSLRMDENYVKVGDARLSANGTTLKVSSSLPDLQIYTGDGLPNSRSGIALESQFRPNDINFAQDSLLQPGEKYRHWIEYNIESI